MSTKIPIQQVLKHSLINIEKSLNCEVVGIERVVKIYGSNANSFVLKLINPKNKPKTYFLKFSRGGNIKNELIGQKLIMNHIPTPELILTSKKSLLGLEWALYEFKSGQLMIEKCLDAELNNKNKEVLEREEQKEKILKRLHTQKGPNLSRNTYLKSRVNLLFYKRIIGDRFRNFYNIKYGNLSKYFNKEIKLNKYKFGYTISDIFESIKSKYSKISGNVPATLGHGDAHHGNIITNHKIWFIDNEYAGYVTPFTELAKPYYNDFIGTLFFHYNDLLKRYFEILSISETASSVNFKVESLEKMDLRLRLTETKLKTRSETVKKTNKDYLSLNEYLILCHALTKNPNDYSEFGQKMFLIFTMVLFDFDPFNPESIYRHF